MKCFASAPFDVWYFSQDTRFRLMRSTKRGSLWAVSGALCCTAYKLILFALALSNQVFKTTDFSFKMTMSTCKKKLWNNRYTINNPNNRPSLQYTKYPLTLIKATIRHEFLNNIHPTEPEPNDKPQIWNK